MASKNPLGHGSIRNANARGLTVHTATVQDVNDHVADLTSPVNAKTLSETTTRYDGRRRPIASTTWLVARGPINRENPPIAGLDGVSAADGLTTQYLYDDNLADGVGLDHATGLSYTKMATTGTSTVSLANAISKLASAQTSGGAGIVFNSNSPGRASVVISPQDEVSFTISDASGRTVMSGQLDNYTGTLNALLAWSSQLNDTVTNIATYGDCLETRSIDALGKARKTLADGAGRTIQSIDQLSKITSFTYDATGNQLSVRDPNNVGQDVVYDVLGRSGLTTDTSGDTSNSSYDKSGNRITSTDGKGGSTTYTFDARGRQKSQKDRLNGTTSFAYFANGQLQSLTDAENQATTYTYDDVGQKLTEQYPDHTGGTPGQSTYGIVTFVNDPAGRVLRKQDQKGDTCTFTYDLAGRLTKRDYRTLANSPSGTIADTDSFTFDKASRMLTAVSGRYANTVTYTYDSAGRKKTESLTISGQTYTTTTAYNARNELTQYTYPDGAVSQRSYTDRGELYQLTDAGTVIDTRAYDNGGRMTSSTYNNGVIDTRAYNTDNTLASITYTGSGTSIGNVTYTWDQNNNKTAETITGTMANYGFAVPSGGYDSEDRLVSFNRTAGFTQSWSLSAVGDWNSVTTNGTAQTRTHGLTHELLTGASQNVTTDAKGNITLIPSGLRPTASSLSTTWDFDNRMVNADVGNNGSVEVSHKYDALGRRVAKTDGASTVVYVQSGQQTIADYPSGAAPTASTFRYVYASYIDEPVMRYQTSGAVRVYYHRNQQYSVNALTDSAGAVLERYAYTAYGVPTITNASGTVLTSSAQNNRYTYTGREWDNTISQYHYRARMYDPSLGRFCARDPLLYISGTSCYRAYFQLVRLDPLGQKDQAPYPNAVSRGDGCYDLPMEYFQKLMAQGYPNFNSLTNNGCVGICRCFQLAGTCTPPPGPGTNPLMIFPEYAPDTTCFPVQAKGGSIPTAALQYQCAPGEEKFIFAKQGVKTPPENSWPINPVTGQYYAPGPNGWPPPSGAHTIPPITGGLLPPIIGSGNNGSLPLLPLPYTQVPGQPAPWVSGPHNGQSVYSGSQQYNYMAYINGWYIWANHGTNAPGPSIVTVCDHPLEDDNYPDEMYCVTCKKPCKANPLPAMPSPSVHR